MDAAKKAQFEQRAVVGLLVLFAMTSWGALQKSGILRRSAPLAPVAPTEKVSVPAGSLVQTIQQPWNRLQQQVDASAGTVAAAATPAKQPAYAAHELRDPLKSLLPDSLTRSASIMPPEAETTAAAPVAEPPRLDLAVQGLWWGGPNPRAIINGDVYAIGDRINGATIVAIDRRGVIVEAGGTTQQLVPEKAEKTNGPGQVAIQHPTTYHGSHP